MKAPSIDAIHEQTVPGDRSPESAQPTRVLIDLAALDHNFKEVMHRASGRKILAVVKAHAYGHGPVSISKRLLALGAEMLGVALVEEGRELRHAGIEAPILVMGVVFPEQAETIVALRLTPVVYTSHVARALSAAALGRKTVVPVHAKIDTGMGRLGIQPEAAIVFIEELKSLPGIEVQGLMTHFADVDLHDEQFSLQQAERFKKLVAALAERGIKIPLRHAAHSAALLDCPWALFTMVRPGLMLYGYNPFGPGQTDPDLKPVLSLVTRIAFLKKVPAGTPVSYGRTFTTRRESLIATLPIGYADGYSRRLSSRAEALVRGVRVPVAGRICMNLCMLDVTDVPGVSEGDEVVLIGKQGTEMITADDIAMLTGTIAYEVLCGISNCVPRVFL